MYIYTICPETKEEILHIEDDTPITFTVEVAFLILRYSGGRTIITIFIHRNNIYIYIYMYIYINILISISIGCRFRAYGFIILK